MTDRTGTGTVVIGCGNRLRGDDAVGPVVVELLADLELPEGVLLVDGGTAGTDVVHDLRGARRAVLVDASRIGVEPGTVHRVPARELVGLAPPAGNVHRVTWHQALGLAEALLGDDVPDDVTVYLVEGGTFDLDAPLSPAVQSAAERVARAIVADLAEGWADP